MSPREATMSITEFLLARVSETEQQHNPGGGAHFDYEDDSLHTISCGYWQRETDVVCDCYGPARVLAECAAKRAVVDLVEATNNPDVPADAWTVAKEAVRLLAIPYRDHPDYDPSWAV